MMKKSEKSEDDKEILSIIDCSKKQIEADRSLYVKKVLEENRQKLLRGTTSKERRNSMVTNTEGDVDLLLKGQNDAISLQNGIEASNTDRSSSESEDNGVAPSAILMGINIPVKSSVRPIKLPEAKSIPPYTTWVFLDKNQRMLEDQSVVGRRRIYYDQSGGEALICSDSEEERAEAEEEKKEYVESEDYIIRMTISQAGLSESVLHLLGQYLSRKPSELKRYETPSNILYRKDMKFLVRERRLVGYRMRKHKEVHKTRTLILIKMLMLLWIHLTTCSVVDAMFLTVNCMAVLKILSFLLKSNIHGMLMMMKTHCAALTAIDR